MGLSVTKIVYVLDMRDYTFIMHCVYLQLTLIKMVKFAGNTAEKGKREKERSCICPSSPEEDFKNAE